MVYEKLLTFINLYKMDHILPELPHLQTNPGERMGGCLDQDEPNSSHSAWREKKHVSTWADLKSSKNGGNTQKCVHMETKTKKTSTNWHQITNESWSLQPSGCPLGATRDHQGLLSKDLLTSLGWDELHRGEGHHGTVHNVHLKGGLGYSSSTSWDQGEDF